MSVLQKSLKKAYIQVILDSIDTSFTVTIRTYPLQRKKVAINPVYRDLCGRIEEKRRVKR